jgi:hypothetical protein
MKNKVDKDFICVVQRRGARGEAGDADRLVRVSVFLLLCYIQIHFDQQYNGYLDSVSKIDEKLELTALGW